MNRYITLIDTPEYMREFNCKHFVQNKKSPPFAFPMGIRGRRGLFEPRGEKTKLEKMLLNQTWTYSRKPTIRTISSQLADTSFRISGSKHSWRESNGAYSILSLNLNHPSRPQRVVPITRTNYEQLNKNPIYLSGLSRHLWIQLELSKLWNESRSVSCS